MGGEVVKSLHSTLGARLEVNGRSSPKMLSPHLDNGVSNRSKMSDPWEPWYPRSYKSRSPTREDWRSYRFNWGLPLWWLEYKVSISWLSQFSFDFHSWYLASNNWYQSHHSRPPKPLKPPNLPFLPWPPPCWSILGSGLVAVRRW